MNRPARMFFGHDICVNKEREPLMLRNLALAALLTGAALTAGADDYDLDPVHSVAVYKINHLGTSYSYGLCTDITGTFTFDPQNLAACAIDATVPVANLETKNDMRDDHLLGADWFNAKAFSTITFKSTKWEKAKDGHYKVTGDLTILGKTKEVTFTAEHVGTKDGLRGETRCGFDTTFTIKRSDFGMTGMLENIGDEVTLTIGLEGVKKKA